ncbi:MAG: GtrA family protein [Clostridia bacterium]|nr:GtrA family protein [Clostridia bacterium]
MSKIFDLIKKNKKIVLYVFAGVLTTIVDFVSYYIFARVVGMGVVPSTIISWALSVLFAFFVNKLFVFESKSFEFVIFIKELASFVLARTLTGLLDVGIMYLFVDVLEFNDMVMKILSTIVVTILNYVISELIVFRKKKEKNEEVF